MKKCYLLMLVLIITFLGLIQINVHADDATATYNEAIKFLKNGNVEFAHLRFLRIVQWNVDSKYRDEALFRIAEFNYSLNGYVDAERFLTEHFELYPKSPFRDEVVDYLVKIKTIKGDGFFAKSDWKKALDHYEEGLEVREGDSVLEEKIRNCNLKISVGLIKEADALYGQEKYGGALEIYSRFFKAFPENLSLGKKVDKCNELIKFESEQKKMGLVKLRGKWMTPGEVSKGEQEILSSESYEYGRTYKLGPFISETYIAPKGKILETEREYKEKYDRVWEAIISIFASTNTQIKTMEKSSGIIVAEKTLESSAAIKDFVDVGYILETVRYTTEEFMCSNWKIKQNSDYAYEDIKSSCLLGSSHTEESSNKKEALLKVVTIYNIHAKKRGNKTSVKINLDFKVIDIPGLVETISFPQSEVVDKVRFAVSTGYLEKALLDYIGEY